MLDRATDHAFTAAHGTLDSLAGVLREADASAEEHLLRQHVLNAVTRRLGAEHPDALPSRNNLAVALAGLARYQEAADLFRRVLTDRERTLGPDHPDTLTSLNNLAAALVGLGRYQEAIGLHRRALADRERTLGPDHPHTLRSQENLARTEAVAA
ncbi:tetratricopeptide repeat protein [Streptomyces fungicidicus]|uniref:tetratricopeptide repeat protein n=1 Tax=Streptomyces fungicidicus TaxID=68203 RepID=UPI0037A5275B